MKSSLPLVFIILIASLFRPATAQVSDDFSDGDFTNGTVWNPENAFFLVENEVLRSNVGMGLSINYGIWTDNILMDDTQWEFWINLDFSTSSVNYADVYLVAEAEDSGQLPANGYFIRFGGTEDEISFYKRAENISTILINGPDGQLGSSNNVYQVRATRTSGGLWSIELDEDATGTYVSAGTILDNEITTTEHFRIQIQQSNAAGPVNSHFFDDIEISPIPVDDTSPELISAEAMSATEVTLQFSEQVEETSASVITNYSIDGGIGNPDVAAIDQSVPTTVNLTLGLPLTNAQEYTVIVSGVADPSGNVAIDETATFTFFIPDEPNAGEVIFNEIFPDPSPSIGLPEFEFIEIYNQSASFFDTEGWVLVNSTVERVLPAALLPPAGYFILCDEANADAFLPFGNVVGIPSFTTLANTADSLTLKSASGLILDIVSYNDDWYQDAEKDDGGYSLELINPESECSGAFNWAASNSPVGGTPGDVNSIFDDSPDETAPSLVSFGFPQDNEIKLKFSEPLDEGSITNVGAIFTPSLASAGVFQVAPDELLIELILPFLQGTTYTLELTGVADCAGNESPTIFLEILLGVSPIGNEILITEIMADPSPSVGLPEAEYFELYNASDKAIDLFNCSLSGVEFDESIIITAGEYLFFSSLGNQDVFLAFPRVILLENLSTSFFTNSGRELELLNPEGAVIDRVDYDLSWYYNLDKEEGGYSLERINLLEPCRGAENWIGSEAELGGTPGIQNSVFSEDPDLNAPEITAVFAQSPVLIEVLFSEVIDSLSVLLTDVSIGPAVGVNAVINSPPAYTSLFIQLDDTLVSGIRYQLSVSGITDCVGNLIESVEAIDFALPQEVEAGDLLINEILFNPRTGGSDFVELYNASAKNIGLQNLVLKNADLTTRLITEDPLVIFPGQHLALTESANAVIQEYPLSAAYRDNFLEMEALPAYNNGDGSVILADLFDNPLDRFDYLEAFQFPLLNSFDGVSLERLSYTRPTNEAGNWSSAAERVGFATPGYVNSQFLPEGRSSARFELEKEVFSPDNDGFDDALLINYLLDSPDYLATIRVFDRRGRLIRGLANNLLLGTEGTLSWDGITDDRSKAAIGPHIILIEIFNPTGQTETFKIPCIVAGNLSD